MDEVVSNSLGVAGRYASALFDLAQEQGKIDQVESDLKSLKTALADSADLRRLVASPLYSRDNQWRALEAVLAAMKVDDLTRRFLGVITKNRRLFALPQIIEAFFQILSAFRGEMSADVISARALEADELRGLEGSLKQAYGRTVTINQTVDPDALGGLVVRIGSTMIDSTLRTQLNRLENAMREVS